VVGAQTAVTSTLGSIVSNVIVLTTTLGAMIAIEWRLTLLALVVLPVFIVPARRVGERLHGIAHEQMNLNAEMNTQMSERFNVAGAMLVKLFGRNSREVGAFSSRAARVRDIGIRSAMYGRVFFVALGLVGAMGAAAIYENRRTPCCVWFTYLRLTCCNGNSGATHLPAAHWPHQCAC